MMVLVLGPTFKNAFPKTAPACEAALTREHQATCFFSMSVPLQPLYNTEPQAVEVAQGRMSLGHEFKSQHPQEKRTMAAHTCNPSIGDKEKQIPSKPSQKEKRESFCVKAIRLQ